VRDASLEDGFARHDAGAYEAAYRAFGPRMFATALRLLCDRESAHECVHDVALTQLRGGSRQAKMLGKLAPVDDYVMEEDLIERERIADAIARLTEGQAEVVDRAYYRGMTLAEVAAELAIPIGTVKGRLSAALRALRRSLIPETSDGT
jgi:DNA-directed RNA polymerase specialized sigma24 family protein